MPPVVHRALLVDAYAHVGGRDVGAYELVVDLATDEHVLPEPATADLVAERRMRVARTDEREQDVFALMATHDVSSSVDQALEALLAGHRTQPQDELAAAAAQFRPGLDAVDAPRVRIVADEEDTLARHVAPFVGESCAGAAYRDDGIGGGERLALAAQ